MFLRKIRKEKNVTQKEIANLLEITQQQVSRIEKGLSDLNSKQIIKLCNYLDVSADELLGIKTIEEQAEDIIKNYNTELTKEEIINMKQTLEIIAKYMEELVNEK